MADAGAPLIRLTRQCGVDNTLTRMRAPLATTMRWGAKAKVKGVRHEPPNQFRNGGDEDESGRCAQATPCKGVGGGSTSKPLAITRNMEECTALPGRCTPRENVVHNMAGDLGTRKPGGDNFKLIAARRRC